MRRPDVQQDPSRGWQRTRREIGRAHARVANLRCDRLHKLTTGLSQTHDVIGGETSGHQEHDGPRRFA